MILSGKATASNILSQRRVFPNHAYKQLKELNDDRASQLRRYTMNNLRLAFTIASTLGTAALLGYTSSVAAEDKPSRGQTALATLDTNENGVVSFVEFQESEFSSIAAMDTDGNDVLTIDEFLNARPGPRVGGQGTRPGGSSQNTDNREPTEEQIDRRSEMQARIATQRFQEIDQDGDEIVTAAEFQEANFLKMDQDGNGTLSADELRPPRLDRGGFRRGGRDGPSRRRRGQDPRV